MRHHWTKIDIAEQYIEQLEKEKQTQYRFIKENEMKEKLRDWEIKNWWWYQFEVVNLSFYISWRVLEIWILNWTKDNGETRRAKTIEIDERFNPIYFKELLKRYKLED